MIILVDYNLNWQALLLSGSLMTGGWLDLVPLRLVTFTEIGLPFNITDRLVWQFAQDHHMLLLTANRNAKGKDSLERVIRTENTPTSLPVLTIGNPERILEYNYRELCVERIVEIVIDIQDYMRVGRLFIP